MTPGDQSYVVPKLDSGTVIDHLRARTALRCLQVLDLPEDTRVTVGITSVNVDRILPVSPLNGQYIGYRVDGFDT